MEKINVKELNDNVFETIGKEWMLVCAGNKDKFNMMTASWGVPGMALEQAGGCGIYPSGTLHPRHH